MRNSFRELEINCQLNPRNKSTLTMMSHGKRGTTWEFECSKAIVDEDKEQGYSIICNFTKEECPVYLNLLRQAEEMSDEEYESLKKIN